MMSATKCFVRLPINVYEEVNLQLNHQRNQQTKILCVIYDRTFVESERLVLANFECVVLVLL